jgi:hypothetical protein
VTKALSTWKELTAPRKVERTGIPASGVCAREPITAWRQTVEMQGAALLLHSRAPIVAGVKAGLEEP